MAFSVVAYFESQDSATLIEVAAVPDQHVVTSADDIIVPEFASKVGMVCGLGSDITQAQLSSPSLRKQLLLDIVPLNDGADEPTSPQTIMDFTDRLIQLTPAEGLRYLQAEDAVGADAMYGGVFLFDSIEAVPAGEIFTVRATGSTTVTANAWSLCPLTLSQQLAAGRYAIVGARFEGATCVFGRLVIPGSAHRPGALGTDTWGDLAYPKFRHGGLGKWGEFDHTYPPQAEMLCTAGDTAQVVWLDLIKIR